MIKDFLWPEFEGSDLGDMKWQQDDAIHVQNCQHEKFNDCVVLRCGHNQLKFFIWKYLRQEGKNNSKSTFRTLEVRSPVSVKSSDLIRSLKHI